MSRVGKYPVEIPAGVQVALVGDLITVKGKLGELSLPLTDKVDTTVEGNKISVAPRGNSAPARMMWGTTRALVASMVKGVSTGYVKSMEITGTGYRAAVQGDTLVLNLGFSHDVNYKIPAGIKLIRVDSKTGMRAGPGDTGRTIMEAFKPGTAPPDNYSVIGVADADQGRALPPGAPPPDSGNFIIRPGTGSLY